MIRNLNPDGFKPFGTILPEKSKISNRPNHHSVSLFADTVSRYYAVADVWLAFESGIAVLSVSADGEHFADFYLDRPLRIKAGVWFDLTLVGGVFEQIAYALPFVHAVELEKALFHGNFDAVLSHAIPVILYCVLTTMVAVILFLRQMKKQ